MVTTTNSRFNASGMEQTMGITGPKAFLNALVAYPLNPELTREFGIEVVPAEETLYRAAWRATITGCTGQKPSAEEVEAAGVEPEAVAHFLTVLGLNPDEADRLVA